MANTDFCINGSELLTPIRTGNLKNWKFCFTPIWPHYVFSFSVRNYRSKREISKRSLAINFTQNPWHELAIFFPFEVSVQNLLSTSAVPKCKRNLNIDFQLQLCVDFHIGSSPKNKYSCQKVESLFLIPIRIGLNYITCCTWLQNLRSLMYTVNKQLWKMHMLCQKPFLIWKKTADRIVDQIQKQ